MKIRSILINSFAVVIMSGAVVFAVVEFVKSHHQVTMDRYVNQVYSQSEQIKATETQNSFLEIHNRAMEHDRTAIDKIVRDRMGMMKKGETYVPLSKL